MIRDGKILELEAEGAKNRYSAIDSEVYQIIERHNEEYDRDFLKDLWATEVKSAEDKARELSFSSLNWQDHLPEHKPYHGYQDLVEGYRPRIDARNDDLEDRQSQYHETVGDTRQHNNYRQSQYHETAGDTRQHNNYRQGWTEVRRGWRGANHSKPSKNYRTRPSNGAR